MPFVKILPILTHFSIFAKKFDPRGCKKKRLNRSPGEHKAHYPIIHNLTKPIKSAYFLSITAIVST